MTLNVDKKTILVTGDSGMIGSETVAGLVSAGYNVVGVDIREPKKVDSGYRHYTVDLSDKDEIKRIIDENDVERIIHLAALAHANKGKKYKWDSYKKINVECTKNILQVAGNVPVLFISTVDVFGFTKGKVDINTEIRPISDYAKSKALAEEECRKKQSYTIFRLSPVYTDTIKRDIQKRYYLKYPSVAYKIGKGTEYEVLNINVAVNAIVNWCGEVPKNDIKIIKDSQRMNTSDCIKAEKEEGRAKFVLHIPRWIMNVAYIVLKGITGENKYTYILSKVVNPLRTE